MRAKACLALVIALLGTPGCYFGHLAAGQARLLLGRQPIAELLRDPSTPPELQRRLERVQQARAFAQRLGLEVGAQYTSYVPWPGDRIVTTVIATRPGEVEPTGYVFPIIGRVPYKGFFDREKAAAEARRQRARGFDVCEVAVPAYSTLGWLADPVTGPLLRAGEPKIVETILHELVHATVFLRDQADFNEGVATFVGQEGAVRFFAELEGSESARRVRRRVADARRVRVETLRLREAVSELYASAQPGTARAAARESLERRTRERIASLRLETGDAARLAEKLRLNDACLALAGTYGADSERYAARLAELGGDLRAFVARLREVADAGDPLAALLAP